MTAPGELNRRLVLQASVETTDGEGGVTRTFADVTALWAKVVPLTARADITAASLGAALRFTIFIRARGDVTTRHQFSEGERVYRVIAVRESADRRFLEIDADVRED